MCSLRFRDIREGVTLRGLILRSLACIQPASISAKLPGIQKRKERNYNAVTHSSSKGPKSVGAPLTFHISNGFMAVFDLEAHGICICIRFREFQM